MTPVQPHTRAITLATPLDEVPGVTPTLARDMRALDLSTVGRLLAHLPIRHEFHSAESEISRLVPGHIVSARGEITATRAVRGRKPRFEAVLIDPTGRLDLVWFNMTFLADTIKVGHRLRVEGKLQRRGPALQLVNPRHELIPLDAPAPALRGERLRPIYPASELAASSRVERAISVVLDPALPLIVDHLPDAFRAERNLPSLRDAYRMQHAPRDESDYASSRRRLAYDELLLLQLAVHMKRAHLRLGLRAPALRAGPAIDAHIRDRFPFRFTREQDAVVADVVRDLSTATPTNRLIQGDVGSGKTAVAAYAMLLAVADRHQAALLAPTAILAEQHVAVLSRLLEGSRVRVRLLTGATAPAERDALLADLARGEIDILVGTHALLTEDVRFHFLAVAIIDEQHRFGVAQRAALRTRPASPGQPALTPHVLVMTATPIPRTLAITLFGDLDVSVIAGLPPGRRPVTTMLAPSSARDRVYAQVDRRLAAGEQAFVVCPAIDDAPSDDAASDDNATGDRAPRRTVLAVAEELAQTLLPTRRVGILHARLPASERDAVLSAFRSRELDVLVCTTIIEVGIDIPSATVMLIEDAERFGLAQLHQLRGRIGRGERDSLCILIADPSTPDAQQRLDVMRTTSDGFTLAEHDLELRGPGEVFGTRQSGLPPFKVADLMRDRDLLALARRDAANWIARSPTLADPSESLLRSRVLKRYGSAFGLGDVG